MNFSKMSIPSKAKSQTSTKSHRLKKRHTSIQKQLSSVMSSIDNVTAEEDEEPIDVLNYREELTYLFFNSAVEHIIESRETTVQDVSVVPESQASSMMNIKEQDANPVVNQEIKIKKQKSSAKVKVSKQTMKGGSGLKKSTSITSMPENDKLKSSVRIQDDRSIKLKKKKTMDWVLKPEDKVEKIVFKNGNVYEGETSRWLMHGNGTYFWSDGTSYKGEFKDGHPNGKGKIRLCDLSTYEGDFNRGCFHGTGVFCISSFPSIYKGSWKNGKKHGYGWYLYDQDNWYEGEWFEDKRHGSGFRQYKNGARYKGMWCENEKNGEGSMAWKNSDFYVGEWKDGKPHGYGEYIWNAVFTNHFIFPYCSWYKGSWVNGDRNGAGVMNFGTECGARLAGIWRHNQKHGPGIMVCGNGLTLQCNPLFLNDKPVHLNSVKTAVELDDTEDESESLKGKFEEISDEKTAYRKIINQIYAKVPIENFDLDILQMITQNSLKISEKQFVKLDIPTSDESKLFCPLVIPIHTNAEEVDLEYFVDVIWNYYFPNVEDTINKKNNLPSASNGGLTITTNEKENVADSECSKPNEEKLLRNLITVYLPKLTGIYNQYATVMSEEKRIKRRVILIRLFLWQLLRDAELPRKGVSLVEVDMFISKNPKCGFETDHGPFEPMYFWQFIQALVGCSWLLQLARKRQSCSVFVNGTICEIFKQFMEGHIFPNTGKFVGSCLTEYKDLFPIKCIYELYSKLGEPLSVFDFLYFTCVKDIEDPPCYTAIEYGEEKSVEMKDGSNITIGDKIIYLYAKEDITSRVNRHPTKKKHIDIFYKTLYTFRSLGRWKIIRFIQKICPLVIARGKLHLDYKLTFLEFYEIVLLCAYDKADENLKNEKTSRQELDSVIKNFYASSTNTKFGNKKRKQKLSVYGK